MTSIMTAHGIGANILFLGGIVYSALQTALSFRMTPYYNGKTICYIRLTITVITSVALVISILYRSDNFLLICFRNSHFSFVSPH